MALISQSPENSAEPAAFAHPPFDRARFSDCQAARRLPVDQLWDSVQRVLDPQLVGLFQESEVQPVPVRFAQFDKRAAAVDQGRAR